ncbi:AaceriAER239Wp [[Ashbya] aceris (nom. inval.)]|nr:AaceriAER239Wp [[Ashbya] aceris (nom. inval.)]
MGALVKYTKQLLRSPPQLAPEQFFEALEGALEQVVREGTISLEFGVEFASFLTALRASGLDHKAEYIAHAARAVLQYSDLVADGAGVGDGSKERVVDVVGTGGDGQNTFNVSTSAAIVAAGIPGLRVYKHGGKASTSDSGAGDLVRMLGCDSWKVTSEAVPGLCHKNTFLFLLAPNFHEAMRLVAPIRKLLGVPTIFNVLGPLLHPMGCVNRRVLGVFSEHLGPEYARAASLMYKDCETFVVWGHVGLDEVSPKGKTTVWHYAAETGAIETFLLEPAMFGLQEHELSECASRGPTENALVLLDVLSGNRSKGDSIYDYILLNAATLYCLSEGSRDWKHAVTVVEESIKSGSAQKALNQFISSVNDL